MIRLIREIRIRMAHRTIRKAALRDLQRMVDENRQSFQTQDYAKRRKAALRHEPRIWA